MKNLSGVLFTAAKLMFIGTGRRLQDGDINGDTWSADDTFMWADLIRGYAGMPNTESPDMGRFTKDFAEAFQPYYDAAVNMAPEIVEPTEDAPEETEEEKAAREAAEETARKEAEETARANAAKEAEEKAAAEAAAKEAADAAAVKAEADKTDPAVLQQMETKPVDGDEGGQDE